MHIIHNGSEQEEITLIVQVDESARIEEIEAIREMSKRREVLQRYQDESISLISKFVRSFGGMEIVSLSGSGTLIAKAKRREWKRMLVAGQSPLLSDKVSIYLNEPVVGESSKRKQPDHYP